MNPLRESSLRILFFTDNFPPETNAIASRICERAVYWVKWGHQVTVLTSAPNFPLGKVYPPYKNKWYQVEDVNGIRVIRIRTFMSPNTGIVLRIVDFLSYMVMAFAVGLFLPRPDVVCSTSPQFFCAVAAWATSKLRHIKYVFELGDLWPKQVVAVGAIKNSLPIRWIEKLELRLYRDAARVAVLSPAFKEDLTIRGIPSEKIDVVINGADLNEYRPRPRDRKLEAELGLAGKFVIGYIGTHGLSHQLENVLVAAERLRDQDQVRFLFVGWGAARESLIRDSERRQLSNVLFLSGQPKSEVQRYWSLCDVALIHLKGDPLFATVIPSKTFEAMAMGLPLLLVAPPGVMKSLVEAEGAGMWVPAADPERLAAAVLELQDPRLRAPLAQNSLAAAPRYTREQQARKMLDVLTAAADLSPLGALEAVAK